MTSSRVEFIYRHGEGAATSQLLVPQIPEEGDGELPSGDEPVPHLEGFDPGSE